MKECKELLHKPNQTIMFTNGVITLTQRKAYNVILQKAWNELKVNKNQVLFEFNISELKQKAGIKSTENWQFKRDISKLKHIDIENIKENGDWATFSLISSAEKIGDSLIIELPYRIREALILNDYYTTLDLLVLRGLEGKYSVILYEMATRYNKKQIPEMTVDEFRLLTGTNLKNSYNDFGVLRQKVLTPALTEINSDKTDIILDYTTTTQGRKTISIKFTVKPKENKEVVVANDEISATTEQLLIDDAIHIAELEEITKILKAIDVDAVELIKIVNKIDIELLKKYVDVIKQNEEYVDTKIGALRYAFKHQITPESFYKMILATKEKSNKKKLTQANNFEQREYSDEYFDDFFNNKKN